MSVTVTATGFPAIFACRIHQGSDERPGIIELDTAIGATASLPRTTTLTFSSPGFAGTFANCLMVKAPRVRNGKMHIVLKDSRWVLEQTRLYDCFNERDSLGNVMSQTTKTAGDLIAYLGSATGLTLATGTLPTFNPRANWLGVTAAQAMRELLHDTGCRMVFNPLTGAYTIGQAATGLKPTKPATIAQFFRGGVPAKIQTLKVRSAPVMYEDRWPAKAVYLDRSTGEVTDLPSTDLIQDPNDPEKNVSLRYWAPVSISHPSTIPVSDVLLLPYRAKSHLNTAGVRRVLEKARLIREGWASFPYHEPFTQQSDDYLDDLPHTSGGRVIVEDHPQLIVNNLGAVLAQDANTVGLSAYMVRTSGIVDRLEESIAIGGTSGELILYADWIQPVNSTESDMTGEQWTALLTAVAAAMAKKYQGDAETIKYSAPFDLSGNPRVGAVRYEAQTTLAQPRLNFTTAIDFTPTNAGDIK